MKCLNHKVHESPKKLYKESSMLLWVVPVAYLESCWFLRPSLLETMFTWTKFHTLQELQQKLKDARRIHPRQRIAVFQQTRQEEWFCVILNNGDFIQKWSRVSTPIVTWRAHIVCWHATNYNWRLGDFGITLYWYNVTCIRIRIMSLVTVWVQGDR